MSATQLAHCSVPNLAVPVRMPVYVARYPQTSSMSLLVSLSHILPIGSKRLQESANGRMFNDCGRVLHSFLSAVLAEHGITACRTAGIGTHPSVTLSSPRCQSWLHPTLVAALQASIVRFIHPVRYQFECLSTNTIAI